MQLSFSLLNFWIVCNRSLLDSQLNIDIIVPRDIRLRNERGETRRAVKARLCAFNHFHSAEAASRSRSQHLARQLIFH